MRTTMRCCGLVAAAAAAAAVLVADPAGAADGPREPVPFPADKTTILRDEKAVYFVEGRRTIPKGVEVTVLRGIQILGRGKDATIVVEGNLKIHGVSGREVLVDGVTIEPAAVFDEIKFSQVFFSKGGIRTAKGKPCTGYFMMELADFVAGATIDLEVNAGSVEMTGICAELPVRLKAVDADANTSNTVRIEVRGCVETAMGATCPHKRRIGLRGGLEIDAAHEVVVRLSRLGGALTSVRDWRKGLIFDGNKVDSARLEFVAPVAGRFKLAQLFKCDVYSGAVAFTAPVAKPGQTEKIEFERFWFEKALLDEKKVEEVVEDAADAPGKNGVRVKITKLNERALELAGPVPK